MNTTMVLLIVDDHLPNRLLLARRLKSLGHMVETAEGYTDATHALAHTRFDAVIADYDLGTGVKNGFYVLDHARQTQPGCLRILTSGADPELARSESIHVFLPKPFSIYELEAALRTEAQPVRCCSK